MSTGHLGTRYIKYRKNPLLMIAVTLLSSYLYCARKLFIERVLGIWSPIPKEAMVKGSIRHSVYEGINLATEKIVRSINSKEKGFVFEAFRQKYIKILKKAIVRNKGKLKEIKIPLTDFFRQLKPMIEKEAGYRAGKVFGFVESTGFLGDELWENLTPKVKPEYRISSEKLGVKGIIDELEVYPEFFVPVELKTGKAPDEGVWPGHKIQVGAYAMLLEESFGVKVKTAVIRYLDTNATREVAINPFLRQEVEELVKKVNELLNSGKIPDFVDNENKCKACDLRDTCFDKKALDKKTKDLNRTYN
jgi:CRISPR-associated exonuclease Cas4